MSLHLSVILFMGGGSMSKEGLGPGEGSLSRGFLSRGSLSMGVCPAGSLSGRPPLYGKELAVRTLLECFLVYALNDSL